MSLATFSVTYTKVRAHYFPQLANFSATSQPTSDTVTEMVQDSAAELAGKLSAEGIEASGIDATANPQGFQWCAETVRLGAAIRALKAMTGQDPKVAESWQKRLDERFEALDEWGAETLGDVSVASAGSILTHISNHSLDTTLDGDEPSNSIPSLRGDDDL